MIEQILSFFHQSGLDNAILFCMNQIIPATIIVCLLFQRKFIQILDLFSLVFLVTLTNASLKMAYQSLVSQGIFLIPYDLPSGHTAFFTVILSFFTLQQTKPLFLTSLLSALALAAAAVSMVAMRYHVFIDIFYGLISGLSIIAYQQILKKFLSAEKRWVLHLIPATICYIYLGMQKNFIQDVIFGQLVLGAIGGASYGVILWQKKPKTI